MIKLTHIRQALRIFSFSIKRKLFGTKKYEGNAEEICRQIIEKCWNKEKEYFQTSAGHFCEFYCRDFGWCAESLIKLGYEKKVEMTLDYALEIFSKKGGIKTTITPYGKPIDVYHYSPDSLAFILRTISLLKDKKIAEKYKDFLNSEIKKFNELVIDEQTKLVRPDKQFSSMKDYSKRKSSCYDNVMVWIVQDSLNKIKILDNLFIGEMNLRVKQNFWNYNYFSDDLSGQEYIAGDANVFPFWAGMFEDKQMIKKSIESMQTEELDKPMPLSYTSPNFKTKMLWHEKFVISGYEQSTIWTHMGPLFIDVVAKVDSKKAKEYLLWYKKTIEKYRNYLEIFERDLTPYKTHFYYSDESMLWAANYLALSKKLFK